MGLGDNPKSAGLLELVLSFPSKSMEGLMKTWQKVWEGGLRERKGRLMVRRARPHLSKKMENEQCGMDEGSIRRGQSF